MNKDHFNYSETFCDAVDIIVSEKLKQLSYDVTKICTIVDNVHKALGKYTVQEETIKYDAYSTNTEFAIGDTVMVLIPNGDYNMQTTIVNKVVVENDFTTSLNYVPPLSKMLDFTGNIAPDSSEYSLLANGEIGDILIGSINWNNSSVDSYSDYTRMGISVDIQTWLQELNVMSGSYGLIFYFYTYNSNQEAAYVLNFDVNDILGNPYSFESYVSQSKVFDISYLKDVTRLDIYFYQNKDFKDYNGELVSATVNEEDIINEEFLNEDIFLESNALNNNLFVNNLQIYLGYDVNAFSGDEL